MTGGARPPQRFGLYFSFSHVHSLGAPSVSRLLILFFSAERKNAGILNVWPLGKGRKMRPLAHTPKPFPATNDESRHLKMFHVKTANTQQGRKTGRKVLRKIYHVSNITHAHTHEDQPPTSDTHTCDAFVPLDRGCLPAAARGPWHGRGSWRPWPPWWRNTGPPAACSPCGSASLALRPQVRPSGEPGTKST